MTTKRWVLVALVAGPIALAGCKDKAKEMSTADHLLGRQHRNWAQARETLRSAEPDTELVRAAGGLLGRTVRRMKKDYAGPNKEEAIAKLEQLAGRYDAEIAPKLTMSAPRAVLVAGVTMDELRAAFDKLDEEYRAFEALTTPKE